MRFLCLTVLAGFMVACSAPKKHMPRDPANWSEAVSMLELQGTLAEAKITLKTPAVLNLQAAATTIPPINGGYTAFNYNAFYQYGQSVSSNQVSIYETSCRLSHSTGKNISVSREVKAHFDRGGIWSNDLAKLYGIPSFAKLEEVPRDLTVTSISTEHGLEVTDTNGLKTKLGTILSTSPAASKIVIDQLLTEGGTSFTVAGSVKSFHSPTPMALNITCFVSKKDVKDVANGKWADIITRTIGSENISVTGLNLQSVSPGQNSPTPPPIKIKLPTAKKKVKTISI